MFRQAKFLSLIVAAAFVCSITPVSIFAKNGNRRQMDSLLKLLPAAADSQKVSLLNSISFDYAFINPDSGIYYANQGLALSTRLKWSVATGEFYQNLGVMNRFKAKYPEAIEYFFKALKLFEGAADKQSIGATDAEIGVVFQFENKFTEALKYESAALQIYKELGNKSGEASQLGDIATLFWLRHSFDTALSYDFNSLAIYTETRNEAEIARTYGNIGMIYGDAGNQAKALEYLFKALAIKKRRAENLRSIGITYGNIGLAYLNIARDSNKVQTGPLIPAGKRNNLLKARIYLDSGIMVAEKTDNLFALQEQRRLEADVLELLGDYKGAYQSYRQYINIRDSVFSTENKVKIAKAEATHELELKEKQIKIYHLELSQRKTEKWFYITALLLTLVIAILLISRQRMLQIRLAEDKAAAQRELNEFRKNIYEKNMAIEQVTAELERLTGAMQAEPDVAVLAQLEQSILLTDEQWERFKELFEKVHKGFFTRLRIKMPDLSPAEIRLAALSKLNLSNKEMAAMLGISADAIRMNKHRLRKKLNLNDEEELADFLSRI